MDPVIKADWVAALRSGTYRQISGHLADEGNGRCCLGVLCDLAVEAGVVRKQRRSGPYVQYISVLNEDDNDGGVLPDAVVTWAGLPDCNPVPDGSDLGLSGLNDYGMSFPDIADHIERGL